MTANRRDQEDKIHNFYFAVLSCRLGGIISNTTCVTIDEVVALNY